MDRDRFDALTRLLGASGSRRATLGGLVGTALLGGGLETAAKSKKGKKAKTCFGTKSCPFPSDGQDFEQCQLAGLAAEDCNGCDFRGADLGNADFSHVKVQGASFRNANLRNAFFDHADASGASFRDACLVGADFFGANLDGASFRGAILCHTIFPNGQVRNGGCDKVSKCCPGPEPNECRKDSDCGGAVPFCCNNVCSDECCSDGQCPGDACNAPVCQQGSCGTTPTPGVPCDSGTGPGSGTCDAEGVCQPNTPNVCSGKPSSTPCFPRDSYVCGTSGPSSLPCHCGVDLAGNLACWDFAYCNTANTECTTNADCEPGFGAGAICFNAAGCCISNTGCASACPSPSS
jgi:hypothetical protein